MNENTISDMIINNTLQNITLLYTNSTLSQTISKYTINHIKSNYIIKKKNKKKNHRKKKQQTQRLKEREKNKKQNENETVRGIED